MFSRKDLMRLIIPLIIEQILAVTVGMADGIMVARVGEAAVSGVSLVDSISVLLIGLFSALATGGAVVAAQFLGHKQKENASLAAEQLIVVTFAISMLIMAFALLFRLSLLKLIFGHVEADVMENAITYFFWSALSYPFLALYNAGAALFRSMGNSKISMFTSLIMNLINVTGNAILIFGFSMGVAGAAIATLIARVFAAIAIMILLANNKGDIRIGSFRMFRLNKIIIKKILQIGIPNGLENSVFQVGKIIVLGIVAKLGTAATAANSVAGTVGSFGVLPGSAIGLALITVVGQLVGARDYEGVKYYTKKLMKVVYIIMAGINIVIALLSPLIVQIYGFSAETGDIMMQLILYHCTLAALIWPTSFALPNALRAANDVKFTMIISIVSMFTWRIGFSIVLVNFTSLGVLGVWIAMSIDWLFRSICFIVRFKREKYKTLSLI
ncbi:MAG: MATE family efflux transporter [Clostridiales bacterium]|nr:MATE family efflux transporter [Clostridiales bacterium]